MSWVKAVCKYEKLPQKTATRLMHDYKRTHDASESQRWQVNAEGLFVERYLNCARAFYECQVTISLFGSLTCTLTASSMAV